MENTSHTEIDLVGHCPVCGLSLVEMGGLVVCQRGHYKAPFSSWDAIWSSFSGKIDDAEQLLNSLLELNTIKDEHGNTIRPEVD